MTSSALCGYERTISLLQYYGKNARAKYFDHIAVHHHNPKTIDQLVNPAPPCTPAESNADCEKVLSYFNDKIEFIIPMFISP